MRVIDCKKIKSKFLEGLFQTPARYTKIKKCIIHSGGRSICTLKAVHYKDPPKILVECGTESKDE